jgi:thiol-disulfide isomerase/thioredoxin
VPAIAQCAGFPAGELHPSRRDWLRNAALMEVGAGLLRADSDTPKHRSAVGAKSPPLAVPTIDGKTIHVHRQPGKVVLVDFMTTSCPSCKRASAGIQALYRELGAKGFLPVAIAVDPQAWRALPVLQERVSPHVSGWHCRARRGPSVSPAPCRQTPVCTHAGPAGQAGPHFDEGGRLDGRAKTPFSRYQAFEPEGTMIGG